MKVLITGGAGFIGSHLAEALVREGHRVRVLDDLSTGRLDNLGAVAGEVELRRGDCADLATVLRAAKGMEVVFHQAAVPSVARSVADPVLSHRANATATLHTLVAARDAGVRRFVYAGSSSVYGNSPRLPKHESMPPSPLSPYAAGKLAGEHYVRLFSGLYGMDTVTLRYFNVFGPRQGARSPYSGVIGLFTTALLSGRTPVIYGDGRQSRDFTYVANVVEANRRALRARGLRGQAVNVATGHRVSLLGLLNALSRQTGRSVRARHLAPRPGDVRHSLASIGRARGLLGYRPVVDFETGLRLTVDWYRKAGGGVRARRTRPSSRGS